MRQVLDRHASRSPTDKYPAVLPGGLLQIGARGRFVSPVASDLIGEPSPAGKPRSVTAPFDDGSGLLVGRLTASVVTVPNLPTNSISAYSSESQAAWLTVVIRRSGSVTMRMSNIEAMMLSAYRRAATT